MKAARSTITRTIRPAAISPHLSVTVTLKVARLPSSRSRPAKATTVLPTSAGAKWVISIRNPTEV